MSSSQQSGDGNVSVTEARQIVAEICCVEDYGLCHHIRINGYSGDVVVFGYKKLHPSRLNVDIPEDVEVKSVRTAHPNQTAFII